MLEYSYYLISNKLYLLLTKRIMKKRLQTLKVNSKKVIKTKKINNVNNSGYLNIL